MKVQLLAIAIFVTVFSGISRADACAAGNFGNLIGTSCTIGNGLYTFSSPFVGTIEADTLTFTPLIEGGASTGFEISGFPASSSSQPPPGDDKLFTFNDGFTMVPVSGMILSATATLNGVSQFCSSVSTQLSYGILGGQGGPIAADEYQCSNGIYSRPGTGVASGLIGPSFNGEFQLENSSFGGDFVTTSYTGFTSADFIFSMPESSEMAMICISALAIFVAVRKAVPRKTLE